jgi:hypothetical protein
MAITQQVVPSKLRHLQSYSASGTFYPPAGTTVVFVSVHGASGGGGSGISRYGQQTGGVGGTGRISGGYVQVNPQAPHGVVIGAGGTASTTQSGAGGTGGTTSFDGAIIITGGTGGGGNGGDGAAAGQAGTSSAVTSLTTLNPSASALTRVASFTTSGTTTAGGGAGTGSGVGGAAAGSAGIVHIYGY